jgi:hypothetical protein
MLARTTIAGIILLSGSIGTAIPAEPAGAELQRSFAETVHPFLETYCFTCHNKEKQKGKLDLSPYTKMEAVVQDYRLWEIVLEKLTAEEMPPEEAERQPAVKARRAVIQWIQAMRRYEAERNAGDPGPVLARRLSNAEYDYTIRDLTGVDIRPTQEFPVDPANESGFDNSGESLTMSPALLNKYLEAARRVAEHIVLKPTGFVFAPHPAVTETDRDKYCVKRIIDFYQRHRTDLADYFTAAWRFQHRAALGKSESTLPDLAAEEKISAKYLATIWSALADSPEEIGPFARLQTMWRELPAPTGSQPEAVRRGCEQMRDFVLHLRQKLKPQFQNLSVRGIAAGSQPFVLWKDRQYATNRLRYNRGALQIQNAPKPDGASDNGNRQHGEAAPSTPGDPNLRLVTLGATGRTEQPGLTNAVDQVLIIPAGEAERARYEAAFERFCRIFPDAFFVSERGLIFLKEDKESRGRLLSAGFHLMVGYFRDDAPLYELILDEQKQRELDALWEEFHFITLDPIRQYKDFIFFERAEPPRFAQGAEFDFARSEDKDSTSEAKIKQMAEAYLAKARRNAGEGPAIDAIEEYFKNISKEIRWVEQARMAAESSHLETLQTFAERAYRRPLSPSERSEVLAFYGSLREKEGLNHEEAIRDTVASVLMSPYFCYRVDRLADEPKGNSRREAAYSSTPEGQSLLTSAATIERSGVRPLSDYALASRLSYFLWSSMPDDELLARAAAGDLHRPEVIAAQARRMLKDNRIHGLATEFGGNWLDFRRFEEHNSVDRERFASFNNELRQAMFEEPIRFFTDLVRADRSVLNFLYADYTFVNPVLARHYGIPGLAVSTNEWVRVDFARRYQRGGLLPMSVFLTKNAPGLRTSPVKRGYWVVRRLLGERIPPPPPNVPELPNDEAKLGNLTLRETLARHREDKSCAGCHMRFDAIGLVFEGYGPVGELRTQDFAGRPVETQATFPGGSEGTGLDGLRNYLREHRQEEFLDNLCRKLLAYGLGRTLSLSDNGTIHEMRAKLTAHNFQFGSLVESIVASPQFLNKRVDEEISQK